MTVRPAARLLILFTLLGACRATPPGPLEKRVAALVKRRITVGGRDERNPLPDTPDNLARGRSAFASYCTACHGLDGQATGVPFARAMSPPVPSLASPEVQAYSDGQLRWIVENGLFPSGMPASRGLLSGEEMWRIVLFVRHLPPAGSLGDPPAYLHSPPGSPCAAR
ncbi:MAG TPA: cytochrome c [Anaeromyxobacteraceae bacterium]|nr:cytochrome c [Anaeromyxobacteraceae bacterium]